VGADLFGIGKSALDASKKSLATSSHNIANANNENFSRQRVNLRTNTPIGEGNYVVGSGVNVRSIRRVHDDLVEKRLNNSISANTYDTERTTQLGRIEEVFNEVNSDGTNKVMNRFFNSFRELANQPDNETVRSIVRENARVVVKDFKSQTENIDMIRDGIDTKMSVAVTDINQLSYSISKLNKEIAVIEVTSQEVGDLRDQRDAAVRTLSEFFNLKTYIDNRGQYTVNVAGVGTLVTGTAVQEMKVGKILEKETGRGKTEIYFKDKPSAPITHKFQAGKIHALYKTREVEMKAVEDNMNELAYTLAKSTNAVHKQGFKQIPLAEDQHGNIILTGREGKVTGINFFRDPTSKIRAAEYLELSDDVKSDLKNVITGYEPNKPGDNRIAIAISKLQHEKLIQGGVATMEDHYLETVGNIGLKSGKAKVDAEQSTGILAQAKSIKTRISGVSIDEETANMMKFQQSYQASARVIKVADEMFDSVLNMVGR
jgi:flagellar hook-associated protein 1